MPVHPGVQIWVTPGCPLSHPGESPSPDEISPPASQCALAVIAKTKTPAIMWDRKVRVTLGLSWQPVRRSSGFPCVAGSGHTLRLQTYTHTNLFGLRHYKPTSARSYRKRLKK